MIRLSLDCEAQPSQNMRLNAADWHYLSQVMRRNVGDKLEVLTSDGQVWTVHIEGEREIAFDHPIVTGITLKRDITLYQALLKGDHFGSVVERGTEAGIRHFVPLITERTISRDVSANKLTRWRAIAKEASEQSRRMEVPDIVEPMRLKDLIVPSKTQGFVLDPLGPYERAWLLLDTSPLGLVVGPEGGLSAMEFELLFHAGFAPLSLGPRVYRAENAGAFAAVLFLQ